MAEFYFEVMEEAEAFADRIGKTVEYGPVNVFYPGFNYLVEDEEDEVNGVVLVVKGFRMVG